MRWIPAVIVALVVSWSSHELVVDYLAMEHWTSPWPVIAVGAFASLAAIVITWHLTRERQVMVNLPRAMLRQEFDQRVFAR